MAGEQERGRRRGCGAPRRAARGAQQDAAAGGTEGAGEGSRREVASVRWMQRYTLVRREQRASWRGTRRRARSGALAGGVHWRGTRYGAGSGTLAGGVHAGTQGAARRLEGYMNQGYTLARGERHASCRGTRERYTLVRREQRAGWRGTRWRAGSGARVGGVQAGAQGATR
jgi:hypothetical protein